MVGEMDVSTDPRTRAAWHANERCVSKNAGLPDSHMWRRPRRALLAALGLPGASQVRGLDREPDRSCAVRRRLE